MIYNCWYCGYRINERTRSDKYTTWKTGIDPKKVGTYLTFENKPFCTEYCIEDFKKLKTKPKYFPGTSDWYEEEWKLLRKQKK